MKRVFISYCREDGDFADNLRHKLEEAEIPTWQDTDLYGGQLWRAEIDLAIRESLAVVVVMSPEAAQSGYVAYEWAFALGVGVNVVPVLLKSAPGDLHPALQSRQCLDFSSRSARPWDLLCRAVQGVGPPAEATIHIPEGAPPVVEQAARALDSMDEEQREAALKTLATMNHPTVTEVLAGALHHPIQEVRFRAGGMLLDRGDKRCLPAVFESLRANWSVSGLAELGREAVPELIEALGDEDRSVRAAAAGALGAIGDRAAIPHLQRLLADENDWVRAAALDALGDFHDAALLPAFQEAFRNNNAPRAALRAASKIPQAGGESLLIEALQHADRDNRQQAGELLEPVATAAAVEALRRAVKDPESSVRSRALATLARLGGAAHLALFLEALEDERGDVRRAASEALEKIGGPAVTAGLVEIVRSPDKLYREDAVRLLGKVGEEWAVPALAEALQDADTGEVAAWSLGKLARPGMPAVEVLVRLATEGSGRMRDAARRALFEIKDPATIGPLSRMLDDDNLRVGAETALRLIGTPEAQRALAAWRRKVRQ